MFSSAHNKILPLNTLYLILIVRFVTAQEECIISLNATGPRPLFLKPNYNRLRFLNAIILPENGLIMIKHNAEISLHCPQSQLMISNKTTNVPSATATCVGNKTFVLLEKRTSITNIACEKYASRILQDTGKKCLKKFRQIDLGIELDNGKFLKHIEVCYDDDLQTPLYSTFKLVKNIGGAQHGVNRPTFLLSDVDRDYGLDKLYKNEAQRKVINRLVGLDVNNTKYIKEGAYFLARGHLTAKADFVFAYQQRVTFYYVNTAPQWQKFNGANWNHLEMLVRSYASDNNVDLQVYTGTYGVTTLPNENGPKSKNNSKVPLYLYSDENNNQAVPVPELFWKVIHNTKDKSGVAIIGVNNPYENDVKPICEDICGELTWMARLKKRKSIVHGYCYCCSISDFRKTVKTFPSFEVNELLT